MGRSVDIDFEFIEAVSVAAVIGLLGNSGWGLVIEAEIHYMVDDHEWKVAGELDLPSVIDEIVDALSLGEAAAVRLWNFMEKTGGNMMFMPDGKSISFLPVHHPKMIPTSPSLFTDNGWYVARMVPVLAGLGLISVRTRDEYP